MIDLRLGDCLEVMRGMADGSVDAVVTDPPYGMTNESYDSGVPAEVWRECYRLARPDAALISFAGNPTYHRIASAIEAAGWKVRQMWGWVFRDGLITSAWPKEGFDRLAPAFDPICFATKGKVFLRVEREGDIAWDREGNRRGRIGLSSRNGVERATKAVGRYPRSIVASEDIEGFQYFVMSRTMGGFGVDGVDHPNWKPLVLMRWLVSKLPPGGTILDPYMGSGTTLLAAEAGGFSAVGIEVDPAYFAVAERRIAEARAATPLFEGLLA